MADPASVSPGRLIPSLAESRVGVCAWGVPERWNPLIRKAIGKVHHTVTILLESRCLHHLGGSYFTFGVNGLFNQPRKIGRLWKPPVQRDRPESRADESTSGLMR
jgi:hypothetical protein